MAQLVEQRIRNAWVEGSSPFSSFSDKGKRSLKIKLGTSFLLFTWKASFSLFAGRRTIEFRVKGIEVFRV